MHAFRPRSNLALFNPKVAVTSAEIAVNEARQEVTKVLGAEADDGGGSPAMSVASNDGQHELEVAVKKARMAGECVLQVRSIGLF